MKIKVDFDKVVGVMKPMHGVGQPPMFQLNGSMLHYLTEAGIPYSRLHDVQGVMGANLYVDIPNLFRDFDADENDPASYDFAFTDSFLSQLIEHKVEPFYRLGVTIENYRQVKSYRIFPPKDFAKWARICEHVIRHYNEGWADGFHHNIQYWEIWNEPDGNYFGTWNPGSAMWKGTPQQFFEFYEIAAKHLKKCFGDSIKVGGYASNGFREYETYDPDCDYSKITSDNRICGFHRFAHEFLAYAREHNAPLEFFSWHSYASVQETLKSALYCRRLLEKYGYADVPDFLNEWNTCHDAKGRATDYAAAQVFGMMLTMQAKAKTWMLNYYDARCAASQYAGMFNPETHEPFLAYFPFKLFNDAYVLKNQVEAVALAEPDVEADANAADSIVACAAANGGKKVLLVANMGEFPVETAFDICGANTEDAEVIMTNCEYRNTITGKHIENGKLEIPQYTCLELRF